MPTGKTPKFDIDLSGVQVAPSAPAKTPIWGVPTGKAEVAEPVEPPRGALSPGQALAMRKGLKPWVKAIVVGQNTFGGKAAEAAKKPAIRTIWNVLDFMDRALQDTFFNPIHAYQHGERNVIQLVHHSLDALTNDERTDFRDLLEGFSPQVRINLEASFEAANRLALAGAESVPKWAPARGVVQNIIDMHDKAAGITLPENASASQRIKFRMASPQMTKGMLDDQISTIGNFLDVTVLIPPLKAATAGFKSLEGAAEVMRLMGKARGGVEVMERGAKLERAFRIGAGITTAGEYAADPVRLAFKGVGLTMKGGYKLALTTEAGKRAAARGEKLLRSTVMRGTGIKEIDDLLAEKIDLNDYYGFKIDEDIRAIQKLLHDKPMRRFNLAALKEEGPGIIGKIRELRASHGQAGLEALFKNAGEGGQVFGFEHFKNPRAAEELLRATDSELDVVGTALQRYTRVIDKVERLRVLKGATPRSLISKLKSARVDAYKTANEELKASLETTIMAQRAKAEEAFKVLTTERKHLEMVIGKDRWKEMVLRTRAIAQWGEAATPEDAAAITRSIQRRTGAYLRSINPKGYQAYKGWKSAQNAYMEAQEAFVDVMSQSANEIAGRSRYAASVADASERLGLSAEAAERVANRAGIRYKPSPALAKSLEDIETITDLIDKSPAYAPHIAGKEELAAIGRFHGGQLRSAAIYDPSTASDIPRKWLEIQDLLVNKYQEVGRSLSLEEVQQVVKEGKYSGVVKGGPVRDIGDIDKLERGILYVQESFPREVIRRLKKGDRAIAELFDTDLETLRRVWAPREARGLSNLDYLNESIRTFGRTADEVAAMAEGQRAIWKPLSKIPGAASIVQKVPKLAEYHLPEDVAQAIIKSERVFDVISSEPYVKVVDALKRFWMSMTLPMYLSFHNRNALGNLSNMMSGDFLMSPQHLKSDLSSYFRARMLQVYIATKNYSKMKNIFFNVRGLGEVSGYDLFRYGLKNGVFGGGFFGYEIGHLFSQPPSGWTKAIASSNPFSQHFLPVRMGRSLGKFIEEGDKFAFFLSRVERGDDLRTAGAMAKKFLGDYRSMVMTPFERNVLGRTFWFYTWNRFNMPLQMRQLAHDTKYRGAMIGMIRAQEQFLASKTKGLDIRSLPDYMPDYVRFGGGVPVTYDEKQQEDVVVVPEGVIPFFDLNNVLDAHQIGNFIISQWAPPMVRAFENASGKSFYSGTDLNRQLGVFVDVGNPLKGELPRPWRSRVYSKSTINALRLLRPLVEWYNLDPFGNLHAGLPQKPLSDRLIRAAIGAPVVRVARPREQMRSMEEYARYVQMNQGLLRRLDEAHRIELEGKPKADSAKAKAEKQVPSFGIDLSKLRKE